MSEMNLYRVGGPSAGKANFDIVFIHGLMGEAFSTWTHDGTKEGFWPDWLSEELPTANVWSFDHPAGPAGFILSDDGLSILERAKAAITSFEIEDIGSRPIIFITHSLGGLITKKILRIASDSKDEDIHSIFGNADTVVFLATPHDGSFLADFVSNVTPLISGGFLKPKNVIKELKTGYEPNYELDTWYRDHCNTDHNDTIVFTETKKTGKVAQVVSSSSADPKIPKVMARPTDNDHVAIAKPSSQQDPVYRYILKAIQKKSSEIELNSIDQHESANDYDYFTSRASGDRKTLNQKLTVANRKGELERAERAKERATMNLQRYGLYEAVTESQIRLLSDVHSRFKNVETVITAGGTNQEIDSKLEEAVIKPILMDDTENRLNHSKVMDSVYYLTGNCHIKWVDEDEA